ncbi:MAG TPA: hypothetical protein VL598_16160 [Trinickia sp.]|jgi:hypothetical protein|uniref:hypothetical protein n=1 Tax=Trinickia sp. TaxID=2571163 RepID=UPI002BFA441E|nr:hypothetical protein [Trinickia sp.]HTI19185.1 hypothetical protein [Trinickia sp.]
MSIAAAVIPVAQAVGALASFASSIFSAMPGANAPAGASSFAGSEGTSKNFDQMQGLMRRQQEAQLKTMGMQTEASVQKMLVDTVNSIASGHLDSGTKAQNAVHKAAQGIHF